MIIDMDVNQLLIHYLKRCDLALELMVNEKNDRFNYYFHVFYYLAEKIVEADKYNPAIVEANITASARNCVYSVICNHLRYRSEERQKEIMEKRRKIIQKEKEEFLIKKSWEKI